MSATGVAGSHLPETAQRCVYVYWRCAAADLPQALAATRQAQSDLQRSEPGLCINLLIRADENGAQRTVMETYTCASGLGAALQARVLAAAAPASATWLQGERHVEVFDPV